MKRVTAMIVSAWMAFATPAHAEFMTDNKQINTWLNTMKLTLPEAQSLSESVRRDIACLAMNIYYEARGSVLREQAAVSFVVLNRTREIEFDADICKTIFQYKAVGKYRSPQFSWTTKWPRIAREQDAWTVAQHIAYSTYFGYIDDPTRGATYFHDKRLRPEWVNRPYQITFIGQSRFFRLRGNS